MVVVQLLAGMLIGCIVASITWGIIVKSNKNRADRIRRERDDVMRSIGEIMVQMDALLNVGQKSSAGTLSARQSLKMKIEEVNRLLKPNMHKLEVFYVKYIEGQIDGYHQLVSGVKTQLIGSATTEMIATGESTMAGRITGVSADTSTVSEPVTSTGKAEPRVPVAAATADAIAREEYRLRTAVVSDTHSPVAAETPADDKKVAKAPETDLFEMTVADDEPLPATNRSDVVQSAAPEAAAQKPVSDAAVVEPVREPDQEFSLETIMESRTEMLAALASKKTAAPKPQNVAPPSAPKAVPPVPPPAAAAPAAAEPVVPTKKGPAAGSFDNEEFSMETLMDVDINTLSPYLRKEAPAKSPFPFKPAGNEAADAASKQVAEPQETVNLEVVIDSHASHHDVAPVDNGTAPDANTAGFAADFIPEETKLTRGVDLAAGKKSAPAADDEEEAVFELEIMPSPVPASKAPAQAPTGITAEDLDAFDKEEAMITGDDIADKIAALEFTKPVEPAKPAAVKEPVKKKAPPAAPVKPAAKAASASPATKNETVMPGPKSAKHDDAITGDDVADKIDSFFGLFDKE